MSIQPDHIFTRKKLNELSAQTPYFAYSEVLVLDNLERYKKNLPEGTEICYALKANSEKEVLELLNSQGVSFEVASIFELELLKNIGVKPSRILLGTAVKSAETIKYFHDFGVTRYAFDSSEELQKIANNAPKSKVYLRVNVKDMANSVFTMSEKFGTPISNATRLLEDARDLGLVPYGVSFNVGSQARNPLAWSNALTVIGTWIEGLKIEGLSLAMINLGGGFPYSYQDGDGIPDIELIGTRIRAAVKKLPYEVSLLAEPGRALVANAYVLVVSVFAKSNRENGNWLYVDAGAYNALLETMAYQGSINYRIELLRQSHATNTSFIITGPTGDSLDLISNNAILPDDIQVGDKLVVRDVGAYSFTLATPFNGFPIPVTLKI